MDEDTPDARADRFVQDLLDRAQRQDLPKVEAALLYAARAYRTSLLWQTIPIRLHDAVDCPPISGEIPWR